MAPYVHSASMALRPLRNRLLQLGDDDIRHVAEHVDAFLADVHR